jgi:hypothetical protein
VGWTERCALAGQGLGGGASGTALEEGDEAAEPTRGGRIEGRTAGEGDARVKSEGRPLRAEAPPAATRAPAPSDDVAHDTDAPTTLAQGFDLTLQQHLHPLFVLDIL